MKIITRDTDYAIRALACVATSESGMVTVKELSQKLDIPGPFLRKIFQTLNRRGILRSYKGKSGGFALSEAPDKISVFHLIEIFQGPFCLNEHLFKGKTCPLVKTCFLKKKLDAIEKEVIKELDSITIEQLVRKGKM
ncbi:MAG: Rrf2 family transcriptional regulator [Candidatus Omnitrophota bacterium]